VNYVEQTLESIAARVDTLEKQVSELFNKMNSTRETQCEIATKLDNVLVSIGEVKQAVSGLQAVPTKRWESVIRTAFGALTAGVVGYFLAKFK
jgi:uncharacterized protein YoxC